jgi:hypothetical protein
VAALPVLPLLPSLPLLLEGEVEVEVEDEENIALFNPWAAILASWEAAGGVGSRDSGTARKRSRALCP